MSPIKEISTLKRKTRKVEEALLQSEAKFKTIFDEVSDGILIVDTTTKRIFQGNTAICSMLGYTKEEIETLSLKDIHPPEDISNILNAFNKNVKNRQNVFTRDMPLLRKNGENFYADVRSAHISLGGIHYLVETFRDTSERRLAEENIKKQTDAMEAAIDGMAILDENDHYVYLNKAHATIYGYESPEELTGKSWRVLYDPDVLQRFDQEIMPELGSKGIWHGEALGMKKDGSTFPQEVSLTKIANGRLICIVRDITDRKQAEGKIRESEILFRKVFEDHAAVKLIIDPDTGDILDANRAAVDFYGWSHEQLTQMQVQEINTLSPEEVKKEMKQVRDNERTHFEFRHRRADGSVRDVGVFSSKIEVNEKDLIHSIIFDITDRKQAETNLQNMLDRLRNSVHTTIQVIVSTIESRDPYTAGHQIRTADLARAIATEIGLSENTIEGIRVAGSIHDIGKLSIPAEILSKPSQLTETQLGLIKEHPAKGYEILKDIDSSWPLAEIVYQHHERMDGSGYPRKLKGDEILLEARIMAVADVVEAMASHRPYRPALGIDAALEEIENNRGVLYDADVVDACLRLFREKDFTLETT